MRTYKNNFCSIEPSKICDFSKIISCKIGYIGILCILAMIGLNVIDVILRSLNMAILGTMEITEILLGIMSFLSFSWCFCEDKHIKIEIFTEHLPKRARCATGLMGTLIGFIFFGAVTLGSFEFVINSYSRSEYTPLLQIPLFPVKAIISMGSCVFSIQLFTSFIEQIVLLFTKKQRD